MKVAGYRVELAIVENRQWSGWDSNNIPFWVQKVSEHHPNLFFFGGEISPNFDLNNMISNYANDFSWKKMSQIRQILKDKNSQNSRF
jgi:hypothetical protein